MWSLCSHGRPEVPYITPEVSARLHQKFRRPDVSRETSGQTSGTPPVEKYEKYLADKSRVGYLRAKD